MTQKEKAILDFMYDQAVELNVFLRANGYANGDMYVVAVSPSTNKHDYTDVTISHKKDDKPYRRITKHKNVVTGKADYEEYERNNNE